MCVSRLLTGHVYQQLRISELEISEDSGVETLTGPLTAGVTACVLLCFQIDNSLSAADVEAACSSSSLSSLSFYTSIATVYLSNGYVDVVFARSPARHFDNEMFQAGRDIITAGMCQRWVLMRTSESFNWFVFILILPLLV